MLSRVASYVFLGSLFAVIMLWGYFPRAWLMGWPQLVLLGLAAVSLIVWLIFSLDRLRVWLKKRSTKFGMGLVVTAVMSVLILGAVNWAAVMNNKKWDVTSNKMHTLSDQTKKVLGELREGITLRVWTTGIDRMSTNLDMRKFLENYRLSGNGKLKLEIKNPNEDRTEAARDNVKRDNLVIVRSASGREARVDSFSDTKGEEQITNAIIQSIKGGKKTVCFLAGHGESALGNDQAEGLSAVRDRLNDSAYTAKEISLGSETSVPANCEALVIVGPRGDALEREFKVIDAYARGGGRILALLGPGTPAGWRKLSEAYGVKIRSDLIVDPRVNPPIAVATKNFAQDVDIVKAFNQLVIFPEVSSLAVPTLSEGGVTVKTFVSSESYTYAKAGDLKSLRSLQPGPSDMRGPLPIAVLITKPVASNAPASSGASSGTSSGAAPGATPGTPPGSIPGFGPGAKPPVPPAPPAPSAKTSSFHLPSLVSSAYAQEGAPPEASESMEMPPDMPPGMPGMPGSEAPPAKDGKKDVVRETTLVLVGNSSFASNSYVTQVGNMDLFLNSVNFLMKDQDLMGIRPREIRQASLEISQENLRQVLATILLISIAFLVGGVLAGRRKTAGA